jgi:hypothetical protein
LDAVLQKVISILDVELVQLTKRKTNPPSQFRRVPLDDTLPQFRWYDCIDELKVKSPRTLQLVSALVSKNDDRNQRKRGDAHFIGICMLAIMLKKRKCVAFKRYSLLLFSSRAQKQVRCVSISKDDTYTRLNHVSATISYKATVSAVSEVSKHRKVSILWSRKAFHSSS